MGNLTAEMRMLIAVKDRHHLADVLRSIKRLAPVRSVKRMKPGQSLGG